MTHTLSLSVLTVSKDLNFLFYLLLLQLVLCRVAFLKVYPYITRSEDYTLLLVLLDQWEYSENLKVLSLEPYTRQFFAFWPNFRIEKS